MVNLYLMTMSEMLTLPCIAIWFQIFSCICSLQQVPFNNAAAEMCSLRMWQWQMSNYRSDIHVSHLRPTRPAISPTDAECEMRALSLSTEPTRKAASPVLACHPSRVPLGCHSCVTVPLSETANPAEDAQQVIKYLSGISDIHPVSLTEDKKTLFPPDSLPLWHLYQ